MYAVLRRGNYWVMGFASLAAIWGCASVTVKKVPTPTQYVVWTDDMQRQADHMEGLRFYLPRPFVNVFESFPIRTDVFFVHGMIDPDGKYVTMLKVSPNSDFSEYVAADEHIKIPADTVIVPEEMKEAFRTEGGNAKENAGALGKGLAGLSKLRELAGKGDEGGNKQDDTGAAPPPKTGINERRSTNNNGAFAYVPLRGNMDIIYMPDFEEQYVVSSQAGLGNAMFEVNLGQGWSLQGFNSLVDNSEINKRIFDLIDTSMQAAKSLATGLLGIPLPRIAGAPGGTLFRTEGGAGEGEKTAKAPYRFVTMKIVVIHYAAKGLYPVIKPRELQERKRSEDYNCYCILDLFRLFPQARGATELDPQAIERAYEVVRNETRHFTVPRYPYQYISFNTFRYVAVELLRSDAQPMEFKYSATGTTGDEGLARKSEVLTELFGSIPGFSESGGDAGKKSAPDLVVLTPFITGENAVHTPATVNLNSDSYFVVSSAQLKASDATILQVTLVAGPHGAPSAVPSNASQELLAQINGVIASRKLGKAFSAIEIVR